MLNSNLTLRFVGDLRLLHRLFPRPHNTAAAEAETPILQGILESLGVCYRGDVDRDRCHVRDEDGLWKRRHGCLERERVWSVPLSILASVTTRLNVASSFASIINYSR